MENAQVADVLDEIADLLELKDANEFRIRSYRGAARKIRGMSERLEDLLEQDRDLTEISGIGDSMAERIPRILETGTCKRLEDLREEVPAELTKIMKVPGLGPRKAMTLHEELGVGSLDELKKACQENKVRDVEGMGEKTEQKILEGIEMLSGTVGRVLYQKAEQHAETLARQLNDCDAVQRWEIAGSFRRRKETVGDLDILVRASDRKKAAEAIVAFDDLDDVIQKGKEKVSVRLTGGLRVDFRFFKEKAFGSALMYFTGSKAHNISLRRIAQDNDWKLNEYGLFKNDNLLAGKNEEGLYHRLNLAWVPPEMREDRGEVDLAADDDLPDLIELDDIHGDLQCHTTASDGENTIRSMAEAAKDRGYYYLAITDHSQAVSVTRGLDEDGLRKHADAIRKADDDMNRFWILAGVEVDILKSGKLDLKEKVLEEMDWVVASVHSYFDLGEKEMTDRLIKAVESGVVDVLGHPLGRQIGKRSAISVNLDRLFEACAENDVCLEINAQPDRLDLPDIHCQAAKEAGVKFTVSTDAHKAEDLGWMHYGIGAARRGWLTAKDVLNTLTLSQLRKRLG
ncbi:MAG: DNA polymerase/3'-5' exonuclease PolX [Phycisphaerae bacterium]